MKIKWSKRRSFLTLIIMTSMAFSCRDGSDDIQSSNVERNDETHLTYTVIDPGLGWATFTGADMTGSIFVNSPELQEKLALPSTKVTIEPQANVDAAQNDGSQKGFLGVGTLDDGSKKIVYTVNSFKSGTDSWVFNVCDYLGCRRYSVDFVFAGTDDNCYKTAEPDEFVGKSSQGGMFLHVLANDLLCDETVDLNSIRFSDPIEWRAPHIYGPGDGSRSNAVFAIYWDDGSIYFKPKEDFEGKVAFTYSYSTLEHPEMVYTGQAQVHMYEVPPVQAVNDELVLTRAEYDAMMAADGAISIDYLLLSRNDVMDRSPTSAFQRMLIRTNVTTQPTNGRTEVGGIRGPLRFIPGTDFHGETSFGYQECYDMVCTEATVHLTISDW